MRERKSSFDAKLPFFISCTLGRLLIDSETSADVMEALTEMFHSLANAPCAEETRAGCVGDPEAVALRLSTRRRTPSPEV